jgi:hypothetical protein
MYDMKKYWKVPDIKSPYFYLTKLATNNKIHTKLNIGYDNKTSEVVWTWWIWNIVHVHKVNINIITYVTIINTTNNVGVSSLKTIGVCMSYLFNVNITCATCFNHIIRSSSGTYKTWVINLLILITWVMFISAWWWTNYMVKTSSTSYVYIKQVRHIPTSLKTIPPHCLLYLRL